MSPVVTERRMEVAADMRGSFVKGEEARGGRVMTAPPACAVLTDQGGEHIIGTGMTPE
ncbi:hypothetical protein GCM10007061_06020 [Kocuria marina]|nr:hypothetical protein GCM10007061_06020 [Kocuria marina]